MYTPYNIFNDNLPNYQTGGNNGKPDPGKFKPGDLVEINGEKRIVTSWDPVNGKYITEVSDGKTNVAVDKNSVKKYKDRGINIDFGNVGETQYQDMQSAETTSGRFGDATKNEEGWKESWKDKYPDYDKLVASLPRYGTSTNPEVKKFQRWLNETYIPDNIKSINDQRVKAGYKPFSADETKALENDLKVDYGFDPSKKGKAYDGLWGTFTSSRRPLDYSIDPMDMSVTEEGNVDTGKEIIANKPGPRGEIPEVGWFPQDRNNLYGALADWTGTKKYMPWMPEADFANYDPTFYDPSRALANINEQTNIGIQGMNAYSNPQAYVAGYNQMQGKAAEQAANTLGQYENLNTTTANDAAKYNAEVDTKQALYNAQKTGNYYDQITIANQQFDNSRRQARHNITNAYNTGITNKAMANTLNYMHPYEYFLQPSDGGSIRLNQDNLPQTLDETYKADNQRREEQMANFLSGKYGKLSEDSKWNIYDRLYPTETSPSNYRKKKDQPNEQDLAAYYQMMQRMPNGYDPYDQ